MIRPGYVVHAGSIPLLAWAAVLGGCNTKPQEMNALQRENAERQELIEAMKRHPAFNEAENGAGVGKPIDVPTTVPPKAEGSDDHHDHPPEPK